MQTQFRTFFTNIVSISPTGIFGFTPCTIFPPILLATPFRYMYGKPFNSTFITHHHFLSEFFLRGPHHARLKLYNLCIELHRSFDVQPNTTPFNNIIHYPMHPLPEYTLRSRAHRTWTTWPVQLPSMHPLKQWKCQPQNFRVGKGEDGRKGSRARFSKCIFWQHVLSVAQMFCFSLLLGLHFFRHKGEEGGGGKKHFQGENVPLISSMAPDHCPLTDTISTFHPRSVNFKLGKPDWWIYLKYTLLVWDTGQVS